MESLPIKLKPRLWKMILLLLGSLAFVAAGIWMASEQAVVGYSSAGFFGLCALVFAVQLHPGSSYLILSEEGFTFASLFRRSFVPWTDVERFIPIRIFLNKFVGWNYSPSYWAHAGIRKVNTATA